VARAYRTQGKVGVIFTPAERRLLALLIVLLSAGYALGALGRLGLLPAGILGGRAEPVEAFLTGELCSRGDPAACADTLPGAGSEALTEPLAEAASGAVAETAPGDRLEPPAGRLTTAGERCSPFRGGYLDLNAADSLDLLELPGIGPALAGRILALRRQRSGFQSIAELCDVRGIGAKRFAKLAELVCVRDDCRKQ